MKTSKKLSLAPLLLVIVSMPAFAGVIVYSPANGADVSSPFKLSAFANWCGTQSVITLGHSLDSSTSTVTVKAQNLNTQVASGSGGHTVHVKAWGQYGAVCVTDVSVNVGASASLIPSGSTSVGAI